MKECKICGEKIGGGEVVEAKDGDIIVMYHRKCLKNFLKEHLEPFGFKVMEEIPENKQKGRK